MAFAYGWGAGCGFGLGFLNFIGTILFFILVVWVIRFVLRGGFAFRGWGGGWRRYHRRRYRRHRYPWSGNDAVEEARARLARGEIDAQEYERLRDALEGEEPGEEPPFEHWLGGRPDAMETLRLRLARGEIDAQEYERLRAALEA